MKTLNWIAWISAGIGCIFVLIGVLSVLLRENILRVSNIINYFYAANTFFLVTIALFVFLIKCQCKKE